jgi:formiminoglutamase
MIHFKFYKKQDVLYHTKIRRFETKLGEEVHCAEGTGTLEKMIGDSPCKYVVFGIPEDIGVRANEGTGGTDSIWSPFLTAFLNIQSNDFLSGDNIMLIGHFDFGDIKYLIEQNAQGYEEKLDAYRHAVHVIDEEVETLVKIITSQNKIPIAIGGGHNNSYPLIKGAAKGLYKSGLIPLAQINSVNLDAHADFRPIEGRHSGNGFRYAEEDGFLEKYCVIGLQENYLPQNVWLDIANNPFMDFITYEDIFVREKRNFIQAVAHATSYMEDNFTGIEVDLDSIEGVLSSAETPSGISARDARQYVTFTASNLKVAYLHICEGAVQLNDGRKCETTGKLITYLVTDFIKSREALEDSERNAKADHRLHVL